MYKRYLKSASFNFSKLMSLILVLGMVFSSFPVQVFAQDEDTQVIENFADEDTIFSEDENENISEDENENISEDELYYPVAEGDNDNTEEIPAISISDSDKKELNEGNIAGRVLVSIEDTVPTPSELENEGIPEPRGFILEPTWVDLYDTDSMMDCVVRACNLKEIEIKGAESNYISQIDGLEEFDRGFQSGWMGTLNDWFTNEGFGAFTVEDGKLSDGDEIKIMYTVTGYGADLGGSWENNDKQIKSMEFSSGALDKEFSGEEHAYTLLLPEGTESIKVTPTAVNKNFQAKIWKGEIEYKRTADIPVSEGDVITVICGDPSYASMNNSDTPGEAYAIEIRYQQQSVRLKDLIIHTGYSSGLPTNILLNRSEGGEEIAEAVRFNKDVFLYQLPSQFDNITQMRFHPVADMEGATIKVKYNEGNFKTLTAVDAIDSAVKTTNFNNGLVPGSNTITIEVIPPNGSSDLESSVYTFIAECYPTLSELSLKSPKAPAIELSPNFSSGIKSYDAVIGTSYKEVEINATGNKGGYSVRYNGSESNILNTEEIDTVEIEVISGQEENALTSIYTVNLEKIKDCKIEFIKDPSDTIVSVYDKNNELVDKKTDGSYLLLEGATYQYTASKYGYKTVFKGFTVNSDKEIEINLQKAPENNLKDVSADWFNFRNSDVNMGIVSYSTPKDLSEANLKWAVKLGTGWSANPDVQIVVDDSLIVLAGTSIYKLDLETGAVKAQGTMVDATNFSYTPPTYANGMIFCPLNKGVIQAFNAETLESFWVTEQLSKSGQSLTPITYSDGYIYTGFWSSETKMDSYVCIPVTDEEPENTHEIKHPAWKFSVKGGFYWAGSIVLGDRVIFGADDGASGHTGASKVYSLDKYTGDVVDTIDITGDQRSSISYYEENNRIYFTTKAGILYSVKMNPDGSFDKATLLSKSYENNWQSTSTPVVYNGRVYIGIGPSFGIGKIVVADAESLDKIYDTGDFIKGYPQNSVLLSTAYEEQTGKVYIYTTYNSSPGGIVVLEDAPGQKEASVSDLFIPGSGYTQYCICSIAADQKGTLYYKNDTGYVFAIERKAALLSSLAFEGGDSQISPEFHPDIFEYDVFLADSTAVLMTLSALDDSNVALKVNGSNESLGLEGTEINLTENKAEVELTVSRGSDTKTYRIHITNIPDTAPPELNFYETVRISSEKAEIYFDSDKAGKIYYIISDTEQQNPDIHTEGRGISGQKGRNYIKIENLSEDTAKFAYIVMKDSSGNVSEVLSIQIPEFIQRVQVKFNISPSDAELKVTDAKGKEIIPVSEKEYSLMPSEYNYIVSRNGYNAKSEKFSVLETDSEKIITVILSKGQGGSTTEPETITVNFALYGVPKHGGQEKAYVWKLNPERFEAWISPVNITFDKSSEKLLVWHAFEKALKENGIEWDETQPNYIGKIAMPSGEWLGEFDNGKNSGWMYTVNGTHPMFGLREFEIKDGDTIVWHYTDDYRYEEGSEQWEIVNFPHKKGESVDVIASLGEDDVATAALAGAKLETLINAIKETEDKEGAVVNLQIDLPESTKGFKIALPQEVMAALSGKENLAFSIETEIGSLTLDAKTVKIMTKEAEGKEAVISLKQLQETKLPEKLALISRNYKAYEFSILIGEKPLTDFNGGKVEVALPYALEQDELSENLRVYYIADENTAEEMKDASYDKENETISFKTGHFSVFAVVSANPSEAVTEAQVHRAEEYLSVDFDDVDSNHWAKAYIDYLSERGLIKGVGESLFAPEKAITRGEFVTLLYNMSGADSFYGGTVFSDVSEDIWYAQAVLWAYKNGITSGTSDTTFAPDKEILRQDMAVMIKRYMEYMNFTPEINAENHQFSDHMYIAEYARKAVYDIQQAGIITGRGENLFAPNESATRAETARIMAVIHQGMADR